MCAIAAMAEQEFRRETSCKEGLEMYGLLDEGIWLRKHVNGSIDVNKEI